MGHVLWRSLLLAMLLARLLDLLLAILLSLLMSLMLHTLPRRWWTPGNLIRRT